MNIIFGILFDSPVSSSNRYEGLEIKINEKTAVSLLCKTISPVRQDRYEYCKDHKDLETVLFGDFETVPQ